MLISELATRTGVSARALRHYDQLGLLPSDRRGNGYRDFPLKAVEQVRRIRLLLDVGLDLASVEQLLPCFDPDGQLTACDSARKELATQIDKVDESIARLHAVRQLLATTLEHVDRQRL